MRTDDVRHGTSAGYIAGCRNECCWRAKQRYDKRRRLELHETGEYRKTPSFRAVRRVQSLQRLGWSVPEIAKRCGLSYQHIYMLGRHETVYVATFNTIDRAFREMCMTLPPAATRGQRISVTRARRNAERNGWPPPLAWDDIDNRNEVREIRTTIRKAENVCQFDPVVVQRILAGDMTLALTATRAERQAVVSAWRRSLGELRRLTGWKPERYGRREMVA